MEQKYSKEIIQEVADKITPTIMEIDNLVLMLTDEEIEVLEHTVETLRNHINKNESGIVLIHALGGDYDSTEDKMKLETLINLIKIVKGRKEAILTMSNKRKQSSANKEILRAMGIM